MMSAAARRLSAAGLMHHVGPPTGGSIDRNRPLGHGFAMAKPRKVQEPAGTYAAAPKKSRKKASAAPKTDESGVRYLDDATARKLTDRIFSERKNLLHKLAQ